VAGSRWVRWAPRAESGRAEGGRRYATKPTLLAVEAVVPATDADAKKTGILGIIFCAIVLSISRCARNDDDNDDDNDSFTANSA
jgi:hypothetical protein